LLSARLQLPVELPACLWQSRPVLAKEQFFIAGSSDVLGHIDEAARKAGLSRGQGFEDFLTFVRCSLAGQTMEEEYLAAMSKGYAKGKDGKRGIDAIVRAFAEMVNVMEETGQDVLGDIFQGGVTYGENGQFFTPAQVTTLMAELTIQADGDERKTVCDPACGSGRFLLAVGKKHPNWDFTGQDVDHRCAQMTAINLGLNGLYGWAVWQNSLTLETFRVYKIGLNLTGGVIREVEVAKSPFNYAATGNEPPPTKPKLSGGGESRPPATKQLDLF
jgi:hypothetical protein